MNRPTEDAAFRRIALREKIRHSLRGSTRLDDWDLSLLKVDRINPISAVYHLSRMYRLPEAYIVARLQLISDALLLEELEGE